MEHFQIDIENPDLEAIATAGEAVLNGEIICYPTETVYGLGGNPRNEDVCHAINKAKGRSEDAPFIVLIPMEHITDWISDFERIKPIADKFWPGPLTILVKPTPVPLPKALIGPTGATAFRVSSNKLVGLLLESCGGAIISTSANPTGKSPPNVIDPKDPWLSSFCSVLLDVGGQPTCIPSTIVDVRDFPEKLVVVRGGTIPAGKLWEAFPDTKIIGA